MTIRIITGDCRDVLATLPDESVHCVVTSPPYWNLRDYGTAKWDGGDPECDHAHKRDRSNGTSTLMNDGRKAIGLQPDDKYSTPNSPYREVCGKCGARRIDSQIGLEPTIEQYVETMVEVFREVRRVLRKDGTLWLNMGDSYAGGDIGRNDNSGANLARRAAAYGAGTGNGRGPETRKARPSSGLKPKDLCGVPWRVAFALQEDGWYLRQDIIWFKKNPMPESVNDRCTKSHEYLFMLSKSATYFYDAEAVKEPAEYGRRDWNGTNQFRNREDPRDNRAARFGGTISGKEESGTRNRRSVWEIATAPFPEAHFATFPPALVEPCVRAGSSEKGCCAKCGAPWIREVEKTRTFESGSGRAGNMPIGKNGANLQGGGATLDIRRGPCVSAETIGWSPSCSCFGHFEEIDGPEDWISRETGERKKVRVYVPDRESPSPVSCQILDPFGGSGTTGLVADRLGRNAILIELSAEYAAMAERRCRCAHLGPDERARENIKARGLVDYDPGPLFAVILEN